MDRPSAYKTGLFSFALPFLLLLTFPLFLLTPAQAQQKVQEVERGSVQVQQNGNRTTIRASDGSIIRYSSFDVPSGDTVQFRQPSATAKVLNRIRSGTPSRINGNLFANGQVYLTNPAGIVFGPGATVDVGRLYAAAGNISNENFRSGVDLFTDLSGTVKNLGDLRGTELHFLGKRVANFGSIVADDGVVTMSSGEDVLLGTIDDRTFARIKDPGEPADESGPAVQNAGTVRAGEGRVEVGAGDMYSLAIESTGEVYADEVRMDGGANGQVQLSGTISAAGTGSGTAGGTIDVLGDELVLRDLNLDASGPAGGGTIRVGGNRHGEGPLQNASHTLIDSDTTLAADALNDGSGGDVIVWSDVSTHMYGKASARGGPNGGDGGFVEISGKHLDTSLSVANVSAPAGESGTVLFDPAEIIIKGGSSDGDDSPNTSSTDFVEGGDQDVLFEELVSNDPFTVFESELQGVTNELTTNIVLEATDSITAETGSGFRDDSFSNGNPDLTLSQDVGLILRTRNDSTNDNSGNIDLVTNTPSNFEIVTSESGTINLQGSTASGGLPSDLLVPRLESSSDIFLSTGNGQIELHGKIGTERPPTDIFFSGGTGSSIVISTSIINSKFDQQFSLPTQITTDVTLDSTAQAGGNIVFQRRLFSVGSAQGGPYSVTIERNGTTVGLNGAVGLNMAGDPKPLQALSVLNNGPIGVNKDPNTTGTSSEIRTSGAQIFKSGVGLGKDETHDEYVFRSASGNVQFDGAIESQDDGTSGASWSGLTVRTPNANTTFNGPIGTNTRTNSDPDGLKFLRTDDVTAAGRLVVGGNVTTLNVLRFNESLELSTDVTLNASDIFFAGTVNGDGTGPWSLTVNSGTSGETDFDQTVGGTEPLASVTTNAGGETKFPNAASITTTGNQIYGDGVEVEDTTVKSNSGNITFQSFVDADGGSANGLTVRTPGGDTTFSAAVGGGNTSNADPDGLEFLKTDAADATAGQVSMPGSVTTTGDQVYHENVVLQGNTTLTTSGGTIDLAAADVVPDVTGIALTLDLSGGIPKLGNVGTSSVPIQDIQYNSATGTLELSGTIFTESTFDDVEGRVPDMVLTGDSTVNTSPGNANINLFGLSVDADASGEHGLTLKAGSGTVTLGAVGTSTRLKNIRADSSSPLIFEGNVRTDDNVGDGKMDFANAIGGMQLNTDVTLDSGGGKVVLNGSNINASTDGNQSLEVNAGSGITELSTIGSGVALKSLNVSADSMTLSGNITTDNNTGTGAVTLSTSVDTTLFNSVTIDTDAAESGDGGPIDLSGTSVEPFSAGSEQLTLKARQNNVRLADAGANSRLGGLSFATGTGDLFLSGTVATDGGFDASVINGSVSLTDSAAVDTSSDTGVISFSGVPIDANAAGVQNLQLTSAGGNITLGPIGSTTPLGGLNVTSSGTLIFEGSPVRTDGGNIDLIDAPTVELNVGGPLTLDSEVGNDESAGDVLLGNSATIGQFGSSGGDALIVQADTGTGDGGTVRLGNVGQNNPLGGLEVHASGPGSNGTVELHGALRAQGGDVNLNNSPDIDLQTSVTLETTTSGGVDLGSGDNVVVSDNGAGFGLTLSAAGPVDLDDMDVGSLTFTAATGLDLFGNVTARNGVDFSGISDGDTVTLQNNIGITTDGSNITFAGENVNAATAGSGLGLTLETDDDGDASTGDATAGTVSLNKVGNSTDVGVLQADAGEVNIGGTINTDGGKVTIHEADTGGDGLTTTGTITAAGDPVVLVSGGGIVINDSLESTTASVDVKVDDEAAGGAAIDLNAQTIGAPVSFDSGGASGNTLNVNVDPNNTAGGLQFGSALTDVEVSSGVDITASGTLFGGSNNIELFGGTTLIDTSGGGNINLSNSSITENSASTLQLDAGSGSLLLNAITVDTLTFNSGAAVDLGGTITTGTSGLDLGPIADGDTISLQSDSTLDLAGPLSSTAENMNGGQDLDIISGGNVDLQKVGNSTALSGLDIDASSGTTTLNGNISTSGGTGINLDGAPSIVLGADVVLDSSAGNGPINLSGGTVDGPFALDIRAGDGIVTLNEIGTGTALTRLDVDGSSAGALILTGTPVQTDGGNIDFTGASSIQLDAGASIVLDSEVGDDQNAGNILLGSTPGGVDAASGGNALTVRADTGSGDGGDVTLGKIGQDDALGGLTVNTNGTTSNGTATLRNDVAADGGAIDLTGSPDVDLAGSVVLETNTSGGIDLGSGGTVSVGDNGNGHDLTLDAVGPVDLNEVTVSSLSFSDLKNNDGTAATGVNLHGKIIARNGADFSGVDAGDTVTLQDDVLLITGGSDVTFSDENVNAATAGQQTFGVDTDGDVTDTGVDRGDAATGTVTLQAAGATASLSTMNVDAGDVSLNGAINTDGSGVALREADANASALATGGPITAASGTIQLESDGAIRIDHQIESSSAGTTIRFDQDGSNESAFVNAQTIAAGADGIVFAPPGLGNVKLNVDPNNTAGDINFGNFITEIRVANGVNVTAAGSLDAGDNNVTLNGGTTTFDTATAGGNIDLSDATVSSTTTSTLRLDAGTGTIKTNDITMDALTLVSGAALELGGTITTGSSDIDVSPIDNGDTITLQSDTVLDASGNVITGGENINGNHRLDIVSDSNVTLQGLGASTALDRLDVDASTGNVTLSGDVLTQNGNGVLLGDTLGVNLGGGVTIDTTTGTAGPVNLNADNVDGSFSLTIRSGSGNVTLGPVGQNTSLSQLDVNSTGVTTLNGDVTVESSLGIFLDGASDVDLGTGVTLDTSGGTAAVDLSGGSVDGNHPLTITAGSASVDLGTVGQNTALSSLDVDSTGTTSLSGNITTQGGGGVLLDGAADVDLASSLTVDTSAGTAGPVDLTGGAVDGGVDLTITSGGGNVDLGAIGQNTPLTSLDVTSTGTISAANDLAVTGTMTFSGDLLTPAATVTLDASDVQVDQRLEVGDANTDNSVGTLDVNADLTLAGTATYEVTLDSTSSFDQLLVNDGQTEGSADVDLSANPVLSGTSSATFSSGDSFDVIQHGDAQGVNGSFSSSTVTINGQSLDVLINSGTSPGDGNDVVLERTLNTFIWNGDAGDSDWSSADNWTADTVPSDGDLVVFDTDADSGTNNNDVLSSVESIQFNNDGTNSYVLGGNGLSVDADVVNNSSVTQTVNNNLTLPSGAHTADAAAGALVLGGTINGTGSLTMTDSDTGVANRITLNNSVGTSTPLSSITVNANLSRLELNGGTVSTNGAQTYEAPVQLQSATTLTETGGTGVTFTNTVQGGSDLTLDVAGPATFQGAVGDSGAGLTPIGDGTGAALTISSSGTTEFQEPLETASGIVQNDGAGPITFRKNVTVAAGDTPTSFDGNVVLDGLTLDAENEVRIGSTTANQDTLSTSTGPVTLDTASSNSPVDVYADTSLGSNLALTSGSGNVRIRGELDGNHALLINSSGGTVLTGRIGANTAVASVTTNTGGSTLLSNDIDAQGGTITFNDPVDLGTDVTLTDTGGTGITFAARIDGNESGPWNLTLNSGATTVLRGEVGPFDPLASVTTDSAGQTVLDTSSITTTSNLNFNDPVTLESSPTLTSQSGGITLSTVNAATTDTQSLTLDAAGAIDLGGVGTGTRLADLTFGSGFGTLTLNGSITVNSGTDFTPATDVNMNSTLTVDTSSANGPIDFSGTPVDGVGRLNLAAGSGNVTLSGVGTNTAISGLDVESTGVTTLGGNVTTNTVSGVRLDGADSVNLVSNITIDTTSGDGTVDLSGNVDGSSGLTVQAGAGDVILGSIGQNTALNILDVDSTGDTTLNGSITTSGTGGVLLDGAADVNVAANLTIDTSGGNGPVNLAGTANDGSFDLIINSGSGDVTLGRFGGGQPLNSLDVNSSGLITLRDSITIGGAGGILLDGASGISMPQPAVLKTTAGNGPVNLAGSPVNGSSTLTIEAGGGNVTLPTIGSTTALSSLFVESTGTTTINGNITTQGSSGIGFVNADDVDLASNVTFDSSAGDGPISLNGGAVDGSVDLTLTAGTGPVDLGPVGQNTALNSLKVTSAGTINVIGNMKTSGSMSFSSDLLTPDATTITLDASDVQVDQRLEVGDANTDDSVGTLVVNADLTLAGTATYEVTLDSTSSFDQLLVDDGSAEPGADVDLSAGPSLSGASVTTFSSGDTFDVIQHGDNDGVTGSFASSTVTINGQEFDVLINSGTPPGDGNDVVLDRIVNSFTWNGDAGDSNWSSPDNWVSDTTPSDGDLVIFDTGADSGSNTNDLLGTVDGITFNSGGTNSYVLDGNALSVNGDVTNNSSVLQTVMMNLSLPTGSHVFDAAAGAIDVGGSVDGPGPLTITDSNTGNGPDRVRLSGAVGSGTALDRLTADGALSRLEVNTATITTAGDQNINSAVRLMTGTTLNGNDVILNNTVNGNGNGPWALSVDTAGTADDTNAAESGPPANRTIFGGTVGGTQPLDSISTNADGRTVINTGSITTANNQTFNDPVTLASTTTLTSNGGGLIFGGTVDAASADTQGLTLDASGPISLNALGTGTRLADLTFGSGFGTLTLNGSITADAALDFTPASDVKLGGTGTVNTSSADGAIDFTGTPIDQPGALTLDAGIGNVTLAGVGTTTAVGSLDVDAGSATLNGNILTQGGGGIRLNDASDVDLTTGITMDSSAGNGEINLSGPLNVDGAVPLTINAGSGDVLLDVIGQNTPLASLDVDSTGTTTILNSITTQGGGGILLDGASDVNLSGTSAHTLDSSAGTPGPVSLTGGAVDGDFALNVTAGSGNVDLGAIGQNTALDSLDVDSTGTTTLNGNISTQSGNGILLGGATDVDLGANLTLDTSAGTAGPVNLTGGAVDGGFDLTVTAGSGNVALGAIGQNTALSSLTLNSGTIDALNDLAVTGSMTFSGDFRTPDATTVVLDGTDVQVNQRLEVGDANTDDSVGTLDVNADLTLAGSATFEVTLDSTNTFDRLIVDDGNTADGSDVTLASSPAPDLVGTRSTAFSVGDTFDVIAHTDADPVDGSFSSGVASIGGNNFDILINTSTPPGDGNDVVLERIQTTFTWLGNGGDDLWSTDANWSGGSSPAEGSDLVFDTDDANTGTPVNDLLSSAGTIEFNADGTDSYTLQGNALTIDETIRNNSTATQTISNDLTLAGGPRTFDAAEGALVFNGTINGAQALTLTDSVPGTPNRITLNNSVGTATPLSSITVKANLSGLELNGGTVSTNGAQTYEAPVQLQSATTLTETGGTGVTFTNTVQGGSDLTLDVAGPATFQGAVGDSGAGLTPIGDGTGAAITIDSAGATEFQGVVETGSGIVQADGAGPVTFRENVTVAAGDTATSFGGDVVLDGLTVDAENGVTFGSATVNQDALTTSTAAVTVDTSSSNSPVTLNADTGLGTDLTINAGGGGITLAGDVDGNHALALNSTGLTQIDGRVGGNTPVASVTTDATGTTELGNDIDAQGGTMTFNDPVELTSSLTLTDTGGTGISFLDTVNGDGSGPHALTLNAGGTTAVRDTVGGTNPLAGLTTDAGGQTVIDTAAIDTTGDQTYNDPVTLQTGTTMTSAAGGMTFGSSVDAAAVDGQDLTLDASGAIGLGDVGTGTRLSDLTFASGFGTLTLDGSITVNSGVDVSPAADVDLTADVTVNTSSADGAIDFTGTPVDGAGALTLDAGIGTVTLAGVGTNAPISTLDVDAGDTTLNGDLITQGSAGIQLNDATDVELAAGVTMDSSAGNGEVRLSGPLSVDGAFPLTINAGGGDVLLDAIGQDTPLASLDVDSTGTTTILNSITTQGGGGILLNGASDVNLSGTLVHTLDSSAGTDGPVRLAGGPLDGEFSDFELIITAGSGNVDLGAIGQTTAIGSLDVESTGTTTLNGSITTKGGNGILLGGATDVDLGANLTLDTSAGTAGPVNLTGGAVDGGFDLTVTAGSGNVAIGATGQNTALSSLTLNSGTIDALNDLAVTGSMTFSGDLRTPDATTVVLDGTNVQVNQRLEVGDANTDDSVGTLDVSADLTLAGTATYEVTLDSTSSFDQLRVNDGQTEGSADVDLSANPVLSGTSSATFSSGDSFDVIQHGDAQGVNGSFSSSTVTINGQSLDVLINSGTSPGDGNDVVLERTLNTFIWNGDAGDSDWSSADNWTADTVPSDGDLVVFDTDADSGTNNNDVLSSVESIQFNNDGTNSYVLGGNGLSVDADVVNNSSVTQTVNNNLTLPSGAHTADAAAGALVLGGTINGPGSLTMTDSDSGGANRITLNDTVGNATSITRLTVDPGLARLDLNAGTISTGDGQTYDAPVRLGSNTTISDSGSSGVSFTDTVNGDGSGPHDLTINAGAPTTFRGTVGGSNPLASLSTDAGGGTVIDTSLVSSTGNMAFNDPVTLESSTSLRSGTGNLALAGGVDAASADVQSLTLDADGAIDLGAAGTGTRLANLTFGSGFGTLTLTGAISTDAGIDFSPAADVDLATNVTVNTSSANGPINFIGTPVDGSHDLTLTTGSGSVDLDETGAGTSLSSLTVNTTGPTTVHDTAGVDASETVVTSGPIDLASASGGIQLQNDIVIRSTGDDVTLTGSPINGASAGTQRLEVDAPSVDTARLPALGTTTALEAIQLDAGTVFLNGDLHTGNATAGGLVTITSGGANTTILNSSITIDTDAGDSGTGGPIDLSGTPVEPAASGVQSLTLDAPGAGILLSDVGTTSQRMGGVNLPGSFGTLILSGTIVTDGGFDTSGGSSPATITSDVRVTASGLQLPNVVSDGNGPYNLTLTADGTAGMDGDLSSTFISNSAAGATVELRAAGRTDVNKIDTDELLLRGFSGDPSDVFLEGPNDVNTLAVSSPSDPKVGSVRFRDVNGFTVGTVNPSGISTTDGPVVLTAGADSTLNVNAGITAGGDVRIEADTLSFGGFASIKSDGGTGTIAIGPELIGDQGDDIRISSTTGGNDRLAIAPNTLETRLLAGRVQIGSPAAGPLAVTDAFTLSSPNAYDLFLGSGTNLTIGASADVGSHSLLARAGGDLILANTGTVLSTSGSDNDVNLATSGGFINNVGTGVFNTSGGARWIVYSVDPNNNTDGGLVGNADFEEFGVLPPNDPIGTGNGFYYSTSEPTQTENLTTSITASTSDQDQDQTTETTTQQETEEEPDTTQTGEESETQVETDTLVDTYSEEEISDSITEGGEEETAEMLEEVLRGPTDEAVNAPSYDQKLTDDSTRAYDEAQKAVSKAEEKLENSQARAKELQKQGNEDEAAEETEQADDAEQDLEEAQDQVDETKDEVSTELVDMELRDQLQQESSDVQKSLEDMNMDEFRTRHKADRMDVSSDQDPSDISAKELRDDVIEQLEERIDDQDDLDPVTGATFIKVSGIDPIKGVGGSHIRSVSMSGTKAVPENNNDLKNYFQTLTDDVSDWKEENTLRFQIMAGGESEDWGFGMINIFLNRESGVYLMRSNIEILEGASKKAEGTDFAEMVDPEELETFEGENTSVTLSGEVQ